MADEPLSDFEAAILRHIEEEATATIRILNRFGCEKVVLARTLRKLQKQGCLEMFEVENIMHASITPEGVEALTRYVPESHRFQGFSPQSDAVGPELQEPRVLKVTPLSWAAKHPWIMFQAGILLGILLSMVFLSLTIQRGPELAEDVGQAAEQRASRIEAAVAVLSGDLSVWRAATPDEQFDAAYIFVSERYPELNDHARFYLAQCHFQAMNGGALAPEVIANTDVDTGDAHLMFSMFDFMPAGQTWAEHARESYSYYDR